MNAPVALYFRLNAEQDTRPSWAALRSEQRVRSHPVCRPLPSRPLLHLSLIASPAGRQSATPCSVTGGCQSSRLLYCRRPASQTVAILRLNCAQLLPSLRNQLTLLLVLTYEAPGTSRSLSVKDSHTPGSAHIVTTASLMPWSLVVHGVDINTSSNSQSIVAK